MIHAWRVDRRTIRAIVAMTRALSFLTMRPGWRPWFATGVNREGEGAPPWRVAIPAIWRKKQRSIISNRSPGRVLTFPLYGYIH